MKPTTLTNAILLAAVLGATSACASTASNDKAEYEQALKSAQASVQRAEEVKNNWTPIVNLMKEAEELAKKGDYAAATEKLKKADFLAKRAREQHDSQPNPGPWRW